MSGKGIIILISVLLVAAVVSLLFYLNLSESIELEAEYDRLIEEGFQYINDKGNMDSMDAAVKTALTAQKIFPVRKEALILLGLAYNEKGAHRKAEGTFKKGLEDLNDVDYYAELSYHLGYTYSLLYNELKQEDLLNQAINSFSEGASSGYHRADSYFGIGALYFDRYLKNLTPFLKDKVVINFQRCIDIESSMEGYVENEPDSICPLCRRPFIKKAEDESFKKLMDDLTK
ncbi:MAG: hypothetical protein ABIK28_11095 [Planctomycetota bacterium]